MLAKELFSTSLRYSSLMAHQVLQVELPRRQERTRVKQSSTKHTVITTYYILYCSLNLGHLGASVCVILMYMRGRVKCSDNKDLSECGNPVMTRNNKYTYPPPCSAKIKDDSKKSLLYVPTKSNTKQGEENFSSPDHSNIPWNIKKTKH